MGEISRRTLLKGLLASGVTAAVAGPMLEELLKPRRSYFFFSDPDRLYGDGIHDDTLALQRLFDRGGLIDLHHLTYRITQTLVIRTPLTWPVNARLVGDLWPGIQDQPALRLSA